MIQKGFSDNQEYENRLKEELSEVKKLEDAIYFVKLYEKGIKSDKNEHNSLIPYLLDICDYVDIKKGVKYSDAEFPDIDVDFLPEVRDYLKDEWVPKRYGKEYVCNISNYNTFGIKSSLIDIARVLGEDRTEILNVTTKLGVKDEEGELLTWETARALYPELDAYLKTHPRVDEVTKNIVYADIDWEKFGYKNPPHRKRGMGMHASGLVISAERVSDYVPMVVSSGNRETGLQASAWVEGLADTDLSSVGFIKFDFLSLEANAKIAACNHLIQQRHQLDGICALSGKSNWSDTDYLNDKLALEMANKGDLKGIFQFDSDGIRKLVKTGGVDTFEDLAAYTALYRPGCLDCVFSDSLIAIEGGKKKIKKINPVVDKIAYVNSKGKLSYTKNYIKSELRVKKLVKIKLKNGKTIKCSPEHKFLTHEGNYVEAKNLNKNLKLATSRII